MTALELAFASGEGSLVANSLSVSEALSVPFTATVIAHSTSESVDTRALTGAPASVTFHGGPGAPRPRSWVGVCKRAAVVHAEPTGLSTYQLLIAPRLWLLKQRRDNRIFAHRTVVDIATSVLEAHGIAVELDLSEPHEAHDYRVQYGETDFAFVSRLLEEEGISYRFRHPEVATLEAGAMVLCDRPDRRPKGLSLRYADDPAHETATPFATAVAVARAVAPGGRAVADFDFARPARPMLGQARAGTGPEHALEQYRYDPAAFRRCEDVDGPRAVPEAERQRVCEIALAAHRAADEEVALVTNAGEVEPGAVVALTEHPRRALEGAPLLVVRSLFHASAEHGHEIRARCRPAASRYHPPQCTPKPKMRGVQSATVVSPGDDEIHVDRFGRVRVQFHWDREGSFDERSSCWIRVAQSWAGGAFGGVALPRVGQEVIVDFFEGDPERPVVVGRLFNRRHVPPARLPEDAAQTAHRSETSPGGGGYNSIVLDDRAGEERLALHAARDLSGTVRAYEEAEIGADALRVVGNDRVRVVRRRARALVGGALTLATADLGSLQPLGPGAPTATARATRLGATDGAVGAASDAASARLEGPQISLHAKGRLHVQAGRDVAIHGARVRINEQEADAGARTRGGRVLTAVDDVFGSDAAGSSG